MATRRKRTTKKAAPKRTNSNIQAAQRASVEKRLAAQETRQAKNAGKGSRTPDGPTISAGNPPLTDPKLQAAQEYTNPSRLLTKSTLEQNVRPGEDKPGAPAFKGGPQAAQQIAGLATGLMQKYQAQDAERRRKLANPALYGASDKERAAKLTERMAAMNAARVSQWAKTGNAVYMGPKVANARVRNRGPQRMDENGNDTSQIGPVGDNIVTKDQLMSWLADEKTFNQIRDAAKKAGIDAESYDDVAKLWTSVVNQAAATYSSTGKKVTPWALLQLRGKTMKNGKPASKTTVSTSIDEMDPAEAKGMIRNAAAQMLGRDPTKEEIEDFISKAQTIAKSNPNITTTTTQYGFDGEPVSQASYSKGGGDAVTAQAQDAALEQAKQSEDYSAYQAAGVYMPWLMDALASPI